MSTTGSTGEPSRPLSQARQVDAVCYEFEIAWKAGQRPRIEDYLGELAKRGGAGLLRELIGLDLEYRKRNGETPTEGEYQQRFPEHADVVGEFFSGAPTVDGGKPKPAWKAGGARDFRPLRLHAKGGLGEVFVAHDEELHRDVALKRIQAVRAQDPESRRRFLLEAEITGRLEHPGVVPVYGLVQDADGQLCYAMRFIEGETLADAIKRFHRSDEAARDAAEHNLALRQLLAHFIAVCKTVAYAHSRGIIHRDIKPSNIMLGKYGETLLVDWGLAKPFERDEAARASGEQTLAPTWPGDDSGTHTGEAVGTPAYMSPEQAAGRWGEVGPDSDIYSLGATLYFLLTAQAPFRNGDWLEMQRMIERGDFPFPGDVKKDIPSLLQKVCLKAMALKPRARYATALDLAVDIERWLAGVPLGESSGPAMQLNWKVTVGAGLVLTVAVGLLFNEWREWRQGTAEKLSRTEKAFQEAEAGRQKAEARAQKAELARRGMDAAFQDAVQHQKKAEAAQHATEDELQRQKAKAEAAQRKAKDELQRQKAKAEAAQRKAEDELHKEMLQGKWEVVSATYNGKASPPSPFQAIWTIAKNNALDGDQLKICVDYADRGRPGNFESKAGSGRSLIILKRAKE
jgi:serine/threonine protein kinase